MQRVQRFLHQLSSQFFFFRERQFRIAGNMHDAEDKAIGTDHLGDRLRGGNLHYWDARFFQLGRDRSAAASAGASRGRQDNGVDPVPFYFLGDLSA